MLKIQKKPDNSPALHVFEVYIIKLKKSFKSNYFFYFL